MPPKSVPATKRAYALSSPYTEITWPQLSSDLESTILDHLVSLLSPIEKYRRTVRSQSKGKRRKKAEIAPTKPLGSDETSSREKELAAEQPAILQHITVGLNSTVRCLETLAQSAASRARSSGKDTPMSSLSAVFVCLADLPDVLTSTLPVLVAMASRAGNEDNPIRLVPISSASATQLAQLLCQPKANVLGIQKSAPGVQELEMLLRSKVQPVDIPWLREATNSFYLPVKVHSEEIQSRPKHKDLKRKRNDN